MSTDRNERYAAFVDSIVGCPIEEQIMGLAGEAGEVVDYLKKHLFHDKPFDREKLLEELGDLHFYFTTLLNEYDISLEEVHETNERKLRARYPEGFVPGGGVR